MATSALHHAPSTQHETFEQHGPGQITFTEHRETDPTKPLRVRHLIKRPRVRQYIKNQVITREHGLHEASKLELWFDLVFASIVHLLAEGVVEEASWLNVARFILTFWASYSVWADLRTYINMSGTDDWLQRIYILVTVLLLIGFSSNTSGIHIAGHGEEAALNAETANETAESTVAGTAIHLAAITFTETSDAPIKAAFAMISIAFGLRVIRFATYALALPNFRPTYLVYTATSLIIWALWLPPTFVHTAKAVFGFPTAALLFEIGSQYGIGIVRLFGRRRAGKEKQVNDYLIPAIAIEHHCERILAFIVIVLGEVIISAGFVANGADAGLSPEFGRSAFGVIISFEIAVLYFNEANSRRFVHALRRHWFTGKTHSLLHFPLAASIVLMAGCLTVMIPNKTFPEGLHWYFSGSLAVTVASLLGLGLVHRSLDDHAHDLVHRNIRLGARFLVVLIFALLPLKDDLSTTGALAIHAGVLASLILLDIFGTLGSRAKREELERDEGVQRVETREDEDLKGDEVENGLMPTV